jgi:hypothetical protein
MTPMPPEPADPITELLSMAAQLHELYLAYVQAGFTEAQAIYLIGQQIQAAIRPQGT